MLEDGQLMLEGKWLHQEWLRTGLPLSITNKVCGVVDAATRKWFSPDEKTWYPPSKSNYEALIAYANERGKPEGRPYFENAVLRRARFQCDFGTTNVWRYPQPPKAERGGHPNAKPMEVIQKIIEVSTLPGDLVWEPFGGTCPSARVCLDIGRSCESAEWDPLVYPQAREIVANAAVRRSIADITTLGEEVET